MATLTPLEIDVLDRVGRGHEVTAIATALAMSTSQVRNAIRDARRKLGGRNVAHAIALAYRAGLLAGSSTQQRGYTMNHTHLERIDRRAAWDAYTVLRMRLRRERERRHWSLAKLAQRIGVESITLGSWERGDRNPAARDFLLWLRGLELDIQLVPAGSGGPVDPVTALEVCERIEDLALAGQRLRAGMVELEAAA